MTSSWSRITDSSSQVDRSGVLVFQYRTFPEDVRVKLSTNNMQCGILKREICVSQSHKLTSSLFWGILSRTSSHRPCAECSYLLVLEVWLSFSLSSVSPTSWETNRGTEQFSWHTVCFTLPVDCVEMCFCFLLPSRGSSPTCTSCSVGCVCGNCSISAGWMFSPPRMISSFRRPSQCSSNTDCSDRLCHWLHVVRNTDNTS